MGIYQDVTGDSKMTPLIKQAVEYKKDIFGEEKKVNEIAAEVALKKIDLELNPNKPGVGISDDKKSELLDAMVKEYDKNKDKTVETKVKKLEGLINKMKDKG